MSRVVTFILKGKSMNDSSGVDGDRECIGLGILDVPYYHHCYNWSNDTVKGQCELEYPCEVRQFLYSMSGFISITRGFLSYGTGLIIVLGLFLNILSFYTLVSSGLSKGGSGIYLLSLAVCDSGNLLANYAVGIARGHIIRFNQYFMDGEWLCRLHAVFVDVFQLISAWIVVGFTVERCVAIWYPMLFRNKSRTKRARIVVFSLSAVSTLFSLTKLFLTGFEGDSVFGYPPCYSKRYRWEGVSYVRVAFQTWIPTVMVFVFNLLMFYKLQRVKQHRRQLTKYKRPGLRGEGVRKPSFINRPSPTAPMLIAVSLTYLILVFPLGMIQTTELVWNIHHKPPDYPGVGSDTDLQLAREEYVQWKTTKLLLKYIRSFCFGFYQINFAINFFLYFAAGLQFRLHLQHKISAFFKRIGIETCGGGRPHTEESQELASVTASTIIPSRTRRSLSRASTILSTDSRRENPTSNGYKEPASTPTKNENSAMVAQTVAQLAAINNKLVTRTSSNDPDCFSDSDEDGMHLKRIFGNHLVDINNVSSPVAGRPSIPRRTSFSPEVISEEPCSHQCFTSPTHSNGGSPNKCQNKVGCPFRSRHSVSSTHSVGNGNVHSGNQPSQSPNGPVETEYQFPPNSPPEPGRRHSSPPHHSPPTRDRSPPRLHHYSPPSHDHDPGHSP